MVFWIIILWLSEKGDAKTKMNFDKKTEKLNFSCFFDC
jgi:hypothetical protein